MTQTRAALVTGGASGIGRAVAARLLADGSAVMIADLHAERGAATAAELGGPVRFVRADVADEDDVHAAVDATVAAFGRLDCVVNNAGVGGAFGALTEIEVEDWDYTFAVLVREPRHRRLPGLAAAPALGVQDEHVHAHERAPAPADLAVHAGVHSLLHPP